MLKPINAADCRRLEDKKGALDLRRLFTAPSPDISGSAFEHGGLPKMPISREDLIQLSGAFVEQLNSSLGRLKPTLEKTSRFPILYLPIKAPEAFYFPIDSSRGYCVITLGLTELLKYQATVSVWQSLMLGLQRELGTEFKQVPAVEQFLNLRSLMFLKGFATLPRLEEEMESSIVKKGSVVAQVATAFIILHETGHGEYAALDQAAKEQYRELIYRAEYSERPLTDQKIEEFFADTHAISCFPIAAKGAVIQASTTFFNLLSYLEAARFVSDRTHPSTISRVRNLMRASPGRHDSLEEWFSTLEEGIEKMKSFRMSLRKVQRNPNSDPEIFFSEIQEFLSPVDWRLTVRACNLLIGDGWRGSTSQ